MLKSNLLINTGPYSNIITISLLKLYGVILSLAFALFAVSTRVDESAVLIGIVKRAKVFFPISQLKEMTDFKCVATCLRPHGTYNTRTP